jgi:hypothetical protein
MVSAVWVTQVSAYGAAGETYRRIWPRESIREVIAPDDWPAIEEARKRGIENN